MDVVHVVVHVIDWRCLHCSKHNRCLADGEGDSLQPQLTLFFEAHKSCGILFHFWGQKQF